MPDAFMDQDIPAINGTPLAALPRGVVRPPQHVLAHVAREKSRHAGPGAEEYAKRTLDDLTLAWYYEGQNVAYRSEADGIEVLAVGFEEVAAFLQSASPELRQDVRVVQP